MRLRNRRALQDKTPGNTPRAIGRRKANVKAESSARKGDHVGDEDEKLPALSLFRRSDAQRAMSPELEEEPAMPVESTPVARRSRKPLIAPASAKPMARKVFSPLPPSSPPSMSSELEYEEAPPLSRLLPVAGEDEENKENNSEHEDKENDFEEDRENVVHTLSSPVVPTPLRQVVGPLRQVADSSSDDPFGFSALERRLKVKREHKRHTSFAPAPAPVPASHSIAKGKAAARPRAPLGELPLEPVASTSVLKARAPTPYHESDDLEDMYLDPNTLSDPVPAPAPITFPASEQSDENANMSPPTGLEGLEKEMDEEEQAELERELRRVEKGKGKEAASRSPSSSSENDVTRTPHAQHVANIYPLRSPFSSREATPCDRSLPDSAPSSPSPMKPMTVIHSFPVGSAVKGSAKKGRTPAKTRLRPPIEFPLSKRRRVTLGKENDTSMRQTSEGPVEAVKNIERVLPKRAVRRSGRITDAVTTTTTTTVTTARSLAAPSATPEPGAKPRRGRGRPPKAKVLVPDSATDRESSSENEVSEEDSPTVRRKRKAPVAKKAAPVKKSRAQLPPSSSRSTLPSKRTKPQSGAQTRAKAATKSKRRAAPELEEENSDEARERQARIEYFKKLDGFSLEQEDVYVI